MSLQGNPSQPRGLKDRNRSCVTTYLDHSFSTDDPDLVSVIDELPLWSAPFGLDLLDAVYLRPNLKALDVGCGLGFPLLELAYRLGNSCLVFGLDPWERALERVKLKIKVLDIKNVEVVNAVAECMPFADDYFDLIVSNNGMNNVEDMKLSLTECSRVSTAGAQFVLTFNLQDTMIEFYQVFEQTLREYQLADEIDKMRAQIYSKRKPLGEVESLLEAARFTIGDIKHGSFNIDFVDGTAMFNHYLIKYWFLDGWKSVVKVEDRIRIFHEMERRLNQSVQIEGRLRLTVPYVTINCTNTKRH